MDREMGVGALFESHHHLHSLVADQTEPTNLPSTEQFDSAPYFKIRAADSSGERSSANVLIDKMYATRGYQIPELPDAETPNLITLVASDHHATIGTLTIGFDCGEGLLVDDLFPEEVDKLRDSGRKVCEFTKLAMDSVIRSKRVLATLFNVAYIYAHLIKGADDLLIEVNPRHVRYYMAMFGFTVIGPKRLNRRVNAPAVLLSIDLEYGRRQIEMYGGRPEMAAEVRSLYPYFFSQREEAGIMGRLRRTNIQMTQIFGSEASEPKAHGGVMPSEFADASMRPGQGATRRDGGPARAAA